jgi:peptidoglycan/xylan/chitin deacetylase (PgdA/CDA1 family)
MTMEVGRLIAGALAPAGKRARLSVLIYHRVRAVTDPLFPDELDGAGFDRHLSILSSLFNLLPLQEAVRRLRDDDLPARPACITFDDGYADNATVALPMLQRHGMTATFFISTGYLDGGRMWNDTVIESVRQAVGDTLDLTSIGLQPFPITTHRARREAIDTLLATFKYLDPAERSDRCAAVQELAKAAPPDDLMLTSMQVRELQNGGMDIGAHTVSHPILTRTSLDAARQEIGDSRDVLQALTGRAVSLFAYPNGKPQVDYNAQHVLMTRDLGFDAAVSTGWGVACNATDPFQLPRFTPWDRTAAGIKLRLLRNLTAPIAGSPR